MLDRVAATISRYQMWETGQKVGVAVSGGVDSVCLLHALWELAPRWEELAEEISYAPKGGYYKYEAPPHTPKKRGFWVKRG